MDADYARDEILLMDADAPSESLPSMPIPSAPPPAPLKPSSSTRLLVLLLQAAVMALALLLFFLFAGIAALVLVHLFVAGRALRRRRASGLGAFHGGDSSAARAGLSKEELRRLPTARYASRGRLAASLRWPDCAVCLEGLREGDRCRVLPVCGHGFHKACVDKWLVRTPACPLCRAAVGAAAGRR